MPINLVRRNKGSEVRVRTGGDGFAAMRIIGVAEALTAGAVGWWLRQALPAADRGWSWGLWGAGLAALLLSLALTRPRRSEAAPSPAAKAAALPAALAAAPLPPEVAGWRRGWLAAHLEVGACQAEVRQVQAAEAVLAHESVSAERLVDAHLLRDGYRAWARGEPAQDVSACRGLLTPEAIERRRQALDQEAERLEAAWVAWREAPITPADAPADRLRAAEQREERLLALLRQAEELALLRAGYGALAESEAPGPAAVRAQASDPCPGEVD